MTSPTRIRVGAAQASRPGTSARQRFQDAQADPNMQAATRR